jgi:hypothetical protein
MTNLTTIDNFSMVGLDDIDDFSSLSVISNEELSIVVKLVIFIPLKY